MKILISSLQVSTEGSKGHLNPAITLGLALKNRGHAIFILPLPSPLNQNDAVLVKQCGFTLIEPPALPPNLPLPAQKLARLVKDPNTAHLAYASFLTEPLQYQFEGVLKKVVTLWRRYPCLRFISLCSASRRAKTWH